MRARTLILETRESVGYFTPTLDNKLILAITDREGNEWTAGVMHVNEVLYLLRKSLKRNIRHQAQGDTKNGK